MATVCVAGPDIIILDEPATGLSAREVDHLARILGELKAQGVTMIIIEHQTRFLFPLCDQVTVLNAGEVILRERRTRSAPIPSSDRCISANEPPRQPSLQVSSLFAGYGRFDVVRDINLQIEQGEAVALLGPNGAGKTTVLRSIMGLVKHRRGSIRVGDTDVSSFPAHRIAAATPRSPRRAAAFSPTSPWKTI